MKQHLHFGLSCLLALCLAAGCGARPASAPSDARRLPVVMYHSILKDPARAGKYVVSPETFRDDLLYLERAGYETVTVASLAAFARGEGTLPEKPVLITLDDGYYNNLTYVLPVLEELDMHAVIAVVGAYTERYSDAPDPNPNYAYLSWEEIGQLANSGRVEIANHTYAMHEEGARRGSMRRFGESEAAYRAAFTGDVGRLQKALTERSGVTPASFAYPYGLISPECRAYLAELGFSCALTCLEQVNVVRAGDPGSLLALGRFNRPAFVSTETFFARVLGEFGRGLPEKNGYAILIPSDFTGGAGNASDRTRNGFLPAGQRRGQPHRVRIRDGARRARA